MIMFIVELGYGYQDSYSPSGPRILLQKAALAVEWIIYVYTPLTTIVNIHRGQLSVF